MSARSLLPGGRFVLFSSLTTEPGTERIEAVSIDGGPRSVVVERATTPVWSPTGHLLFARDGAVLATDFDAQTARVRGVAMPVMPAGMLGTSVSGITGASARGERQLLFLPQDFHTQRVVSVARDGTRSSSSVPRGAYMNPRRLARRPARPGQQQRLNLETLNLERGTLGAADRRGGRHQLPHLDQDGSRVVSRRFNSPAWVSADGSSQAGELPGALANDFPSAAGPDPGFDPRHPHPARDGGRRVPDLAERELRAQAPLATRAYEGGAQLSTDGRWLAYVVQPIGHAEI